MCIYYPYYAVVFLKFPNSRIPAVMTSWVECSFKPPRQRALVPSDLPKSSSHTTSQWHIDPSCISGSTKPATHQFAVCYGLRIHWDWRRFSSCFRFVNCMQGCQYHIRSLCAFRCYLAHQHLPSRNSRNIFLKTIGNVHSCKAKPHGNQCTFQSHRLPSLLPMLTKFSGGALEASYNWTPFQLRTVLTGWYTKAWTSLSASGEHSLLLNWQLK